MKQTPEIMEALQDWIIANLNPVRIARFWKKVGPPNERGCREWIPSDLASGGYGRFPMAGKRPSAHRIAWLLTNGKIPNGLWVLHVCDNPRCCNPGHLFLGTPNDNVQDMVSKKRHTFGDIHPFRIKGAAHMVGSKSHKAKLTEEKVIEIRERYANEETTCAKLAAEYGVHESAVTQLIKRVTWRHI